MLTPTEKFIFNSFLFLFFSMVIIAMTLYLPQHITFLTNRAWFYYHGDDGVAEALVERVKETFVKAGAESTILNAAKEL